MEEIVLSEVNDSEDSIIEVEVPKKPPPPVIDIEDDVMVLNIEKENRQTILAKDIIMREPDISIISRKLMKTNAMSPDHWTSDMIKYYNDWGDEEHFTVEKLQAKMDKNPTLWVVSRKDVLCMYQKMKRRREKCSNCRQDGHLRPVCPEPPYVPKCHMCGLPGHKENACPNSICLNCGNQTGKYVTGCFKCRRDIYEYCLRCGLIGHNFIHCSDLWRLFHMTTDSYGIKKPKSYIYKAEKDMWCCNCGRRGHLQFNCMQSKEFNDFKDTCPFVSSYQKTVFSSENGNSVPYYNRRNNKFWRKDGASETEINMRINPANIMFKKERLRMKRKFRWRKRKSQRRNREGRNNFTGLIN